MIDQSTNLSLRVLTGVVCCLLFAPTLTAQEEREVVSYSAVVVGVRAGARMQSTRVTIRIQALTTDEQLEEWAQITKEGNRDQRELRQALERVRGLGRITVTGFTGNEIAVIREQEVDGGKMISLFTARNVSFAELRQGGRVRDYRFSFIQLLVDEEGNGQGTLLAAARPSFNEEGVLEIESIGNQPYALRNVRRN